jgi:DNA polymerase-3 subunit epsilon
VLPGATLPVVRRQALSLLHGQVPWAEEGLGSAKLDYLLSRFGFFFNDHWAMADCRAVLHVLSLRLRHSGRPILPLLLATARRRTFRLWAHEAPIECKDLLKEAAAA